MPLQTVQIAVFVFVTALIGLITYIKCKQAVRKENQSTSGENKEVFLAGGGLSWIFVAGSITLTNLSTDQLVSMNGNQKAILALWEFAAVFGLIILAKVFLPIYYRYDCTTTTELLEKRYNNHHIRALIAVLFMLGNIFIFLPAVLYGGSKFMITMFNLDVSIMPLALGFAVVGAGYAVLGGLRAVAISDTYSGVLLLGLGLVVVYLALNAIDFDFSGIPAERLTLIGDNDSPIPWHTLITGMIFIQIFYWGTNQTITQRAMAAKTLKEGQKGVLTAAVIRLIIIPPIIDIPGIISYKLYGEIPQDGAYGRIVGDILPVWLSGAFAAALAAAVLTTFNSILNSSSALYVCDIHEKYFGAKPNVSRLNGYVTASFVIIALALVPIYAQTENLINTVQQLYGLLSMPILSCFIVGLLFRNVDYRAAIFGVILGVLFYAATQFIWSPFHYIHMMFITLWLSVGSALLLSKFAFSTDIKFGWAGNDVIAGTGKA